MKDIKVLFVDDEEGILDQAKIFLKKEDDDLDITTAHSGKKAVELLDENEFDVIVSDYQMPEMDGLELLKIIKTERKMNLPFILFTGKGREEIAMEALNIGADRYIKKGADPKSQYGVLADAVNQEVRHYKTEKSLKRKNKLLSQIFEKAEEGFYIRDLSGELTFVNQAFADMHGYNRNELIGKKSHSLLTEESKEKVSDLKLDNFNDRWQRIKIETKEGNIRTIRNAIFPLENEKGEIQEIFGISYDITEKKRAEERAKEMKSLRKAVRDVNQIIAQESNLDVLLQKTTEALVNTRHYHDVKVAIKRDDDIIRPVGHSGEHKANKWKLRPNQETDIPLCIQKVRENKNTHIIESVDDFCKDCKYYEYDDNHSSISVPILKDGELTGILSVCLPPKKEITEEEIELLEEVSNDISIAREKILTEQKLKENEKRYRTLFESANNPILIFKNQEIVDFNEEALRTFDCDEEYLLGKEPYQLSPSIQPDGKDSKKKAKKKFKEVDKKKDFEWEHLTKKGENFIAEVNLNKIEIEDQEYHQAIVRDITEEKEAKEELKKKKTRFETLFEDNPEAILEIDEDRKTADINDKFEDLFGYEKEDVLGKELKEVVVPNSKKKEAEHLLRKCDEEGYFEHESVRETKSGEKIDVSITARPIDYQDHTHHLIVYKDISDLKRTEKKLQKNEKQLKQIHDVASELVRRESVDEICQVATEAAEKILDFPQSTLDLIDKEGKLTPKVISSEMDPNGVDSWRPEEGGLAGKTFLEKESYLINDLRDDDEAKPVKDEYKSVISVPIGDHGVFQAISEEKSKFDRTDLELTEILMNHVAEILDRIEATEREEFLHSLLRHDLKNKVGIIQGYLKLIEDEEDQEEIDSLVKKAKKVAREEKSIIDKVETIREVQKLDTHEINVKKIIENVIEELERVSDDFEFEIKTVSDSPSTKVMGGPVIRELFTNLIQNSIKHSEGSKVKVKIEEKEESIRCSVEDDGKGIPEDMRDKLFEKGYKKGDSAGSGLGMYLVREILNRCRGSISVKDSEMGGARFDIEFKKAD